MKKWSLLAGAVILLGVLMWRVALAPNTSGDEPESGEPTAPLAPEVAREPEPQPAAQPATPEAKPTTPSKTPTPSDSPQQAPAAPDEPEELVPIPPPEATGPVAELKQAFEKEPRDSAAQEAESRIESELRKNDISPQLRKSVLCRKSVCRIETLWTPQRAVSFMAVFMRLSSDFAPNLAIDPHAAPDAQSERQIDVYLPRLSPGTQPAEP